MTLRRDPCASCIMFQPFLRFYSVQVRVEPELREALVFQPFLRFYRSCVRFLWVFKFFFGFL